MEILGGRAGAAASARRAALEPAGALSRPLIVQTCSHAGWLTAAAALRARAPDAAPLAAAVFDSSPAANVTQEVVARGFGAAYLGSLGARDGALGGALEAIAAATLKVLPQLNDTFSRANEAWKSTLAASPDAPQLYMYTPTDEVIPRADIIAFADAQRDAGRREVTICEFSPEVKHVELLKEEPERYMSLITSIVERVTA